ncbi:MAG: T9SS type A sorting domain-containing protein [Bacteroidales bacterium]|nr:T9SS type A sorting domain-containing protein [Bacteroidales bacterium]
MKQKNQFYRSILLLIVMLFAQTASYAQTATLPAGDGSAGTPYLIANLNNLYWITQNSAEWSKYYKQTADIDASATSGWESGAGFSPIGNSTTKFTGQYDGQGYSINGLAINRPTTDYVGLFGLIEGATTLKNVVLIDVDILGYWKTAALVGETNYGESLLIENCSTSGTVSGDRFVGGLVGKHFGGLIKNCRSSCAVTGVFRAVGGLVGHNIATIENSFATGSISINAGTLPPSQYGGFVGLNNTYGIITNCYATGDIDCNNVAINKIGGFAGENSYTTMNNCYSTGQIINTTDATSIGGFVGHAAGAFLTNCFWDTETSDQAASAAGIGKTTAEMKTKSTFKSEGWDFNTIWAMNASSNSGYPNLDGIGSSITWNGSVSNNWYDAENWDGGITPSGTDDVIIAVGANSLVVQSYSGFYCNNLTINNIAELTVQAEGSLITFGTITNNGTINVEKTIANNDKWHFIAAPNSTTTANTFSGMYLQKWNESTNLWIDIIDAAESLTPLKGYSLWSPAPVRGSFSFTGTPNTGDQSIAITSAGNGSSKGTNLLGNPYPSFVDWDLVSGYGAKYTWNGTSYDSRTEAGNGSGSQYLSPMEGFFIYTASDGTFSLNNSQRAYMAPLKSAKTLEKGLVLSATSGENENLLYLIFDATASENFELAEDAWKLLSGTSGLAEIYSINTDGRLAVDVRPETESVQLGFVNDKAGVYSIAIKEIAELAQVQLEDTKTNTYHKLKNGAYEFVWETSDSETRFKLHFNAVGIDEDVTSGNNIKVYSQGKTVFVNSSTTQQAQLIISDMSGRTMLEQHIVAEGLLSIPTNLATGVYLVTVKSKSGGSVQKVIVQ